MGSNIEKLPFPDFSVKIKFPDLPLLYLGLRFNSPAQNWWNMYINAFYQVQSITDSTSLIRSSWWFFWVVQLVELILTPGSSKDAKEVIFPEIGELSNPVCEHVNFCFTLRFRLGHNDRNHLGRGSKPKWFDLSKHYLAFIIRDFLFTLKGKSSWFIDV